jgi:uncharacterized membrane protein
MAGKYFCEVDGTEMDLSISDVCPTCGTRAGAQKAGSSKSAARESYGDRATFGLDENVASALSYSLWWLTGLIFILVEQENKVVRFHAMQCILTFIPLGILGMLFGSGYYYSSIGSIIFFIEIILWLVLMIKAFQGETYMLPIVGQIAANQLE